MTTVPAPPAANLPPSKQGFLSRLGEAFVGEAKAIFAVFRRSPEWAVIVFAWLSAAFIPAFWNIGEDHWWSETDSPLFFQPFVPLLCAALLWQDREKLREAYGQTSRNKRRGSPILLWLGCLVVLVSHLVHTPLVAIVGLLLVAAGIILLAYGVNVLNASRRALLFGMIMIPPPATIVTKFAAFVSGGAWKYITIALQKLGKVCSVTPGVTTLNFQYEGQLYEVNGSQGTVIIFTLVALLFVAVWRREKFGRAVILMASGALIATLLLIAVPILTLLLPATPVTGAVLNMHPVILAAVSTVAPVLVLRRLRAVTDSLAQGGRALGKIGQAAQKATDKAISAGSRGGSGRSGARNRGFEAVMDRIGAALAKPFKRKKRDRW